MHILTHKKGENTAHKCVFYYIKYVVLSLILKILKKGKYSFYFNISNLNSSTFHNISISHNKSIPFHNIIYGDKAYTLKEDNNRLFNRQKAFGVLVRDNYLNKNSKGLIIHSIPAIKE